MALPGWESDRLSACGNRVDLVSYVVPEGWRVMVLSYRPLRDCAVRSLVRMVTALLPVRRARRQEGNVGSLILC